MLTKEKLASRFAAGESPAVRENTQAERGLENPQEIKLRGSRISEDFDPNAVVGNTNQMVEKEPSGWDNDSAEGSLSATGAVDKSSDLYKQYMSLEEDGGSRVDDEEGWREIVKDAPPKTAAEYESMVKDYAAQGFDVKAIDMDGDDFTHSNIAIKPSDYSGSGEERPGIQLSPRMAKSQALVEAKEEFDLSGDNTEMVFGYNPVDKTTDRDGLGDFVFNYKQKVKELLTPSAPKTVDDIMQESNTDPNMI